MIGAWLLLQLGVALAALGAWAALWLVPTHAVRLQRLGLLVIPAVILGASLGPEARPFTAPAHVWAPAGEAAARIVVADTWSAPTPAPGDLTPLLALLVLSAVTTVGPLLGLARALRGSRRLRRIHGVELRLAPAVRTSFAVWLGRPIVVLDPDTAMDPALAAVAVHHELQHHRAHDPAWALALVALRALSPFAILLRPAFAAAEELACDRAVTRRVPAPRYAEALLHLATRAAPTPLAAGLGGISLRWRLTMLLRPPAPSRLRSLAAMLLVPLGVVMAAPLGWAADGLVSVHTVAPTRLAAAAATLEQAGFFGADHARVKASLDQLLASPQRRKGLAAALDRAAPLRPTIEARLTAAGLPATLSAVPLVESGYRNLRAEDLSASVPETSRGAGYWMFIATTARTYGLRVDTVDERLDLDKETTAAIALLDADYRRYGDWALALAAYNQGESAVDAAIAQGGTRDAFALADQGLLNDYVDQVYAAALVMADPSLAR